MGIRILEFLLLVLIIKTPTLLTKVTEMSGFEQSSLIVWIQGISFIIFTLLLSLKNLFQCNIKIESETKNRFYNTDFSVIFFKENGDVTKDFEREININIRINYINKVYVKFLSILLKDLYLCYELERDDITIRSNTLDVEGTYRGIKYPLNVVIKKHLNKSDKSEIEIGILAKIVVSNIENYVDDQIEIIYPEILTKDNKKIFFRRLFLKSELKTYKFKVKIERYIGEE